MPRAETAFLFDLDGTLVDSVYQHVLAWKEALDGEGIPLSVWRIHRKIGMSGGLFTHILLRETGLDITPERVDRLVTRMRRLTRVVPVLRRCCAVELLAWLTAQKIPWAIATSGRMETAGHNLEGLGVDPARVPVVTRSGAPCQPIRPARHAAARLGVDIHNALVLLASIWDMLAAQGPARWCRAVGGYGEDELARAGAFASMPTPPTCCTISTKSRRAAETRGIKKPRLPPCRPAAGVVNRGMSLVRLFRHCRTRALFLSAPHRTGHHDPPGRTVHKL
jgi:beta-phosphoglucomutase-like phosphatase (HAD superfamily)